MQQKKSSPEEQNLLPGGTELSVLIHAVFDSGIIIDASSFGFHQFRTYADQTIVLLQEWYPKAKWFQEDAEALRGHDDPIDFLPTVNLSYIVARCPELLAQDHIDFTTSTGTTCTVEFAAPTIYFHPFSTGVVSLEAKFHWNQPGTSKDLREVNDHLQKQLGPLIEGKLKNLIQIFDKAVRATKVPLYVPPFTALVQASLDRDLLYWSHFVYVAQPTNVANIQRCAAWLQHLMLPTDQQGVNNMAIKPDRYIYFGSGRSMIVCPTTFDEKTIHAYARVIEVRNYLWKALFDLDRGLQKALKQVKEVQNKGSEQEALKWASKLRSLDFRVKTVLEEGGIFKITFDQEKIYLVRQMDIYWNTDDIVKSVQERLKSFYDFYNYTEDFRSRKREERLQAVLNFIGVIATSGTIAGIIGYLDPGNHLTFGLRLTLFLAGTAAAAILFYTVMAIVRSIRSDEEW